MAQATIATTVTGLQGHPVATTAPSVVGQLLTWNGSAWAPDNTTYMPVAGGTFTGPVTLAGAATEANQPVTLTQAATAVGANIGRNFIHNPQFNINQRGSASYSGTAPFSAYTVDRWAQSIFAAGDSNTTTVATASDADRAAIGDETANAYLSFAFAGGNAAGNTIQIYHRIENVRRLGNKICTLSFWAYSPTSLRLGVAYVQNFGTGGSPSGQVAANIFTPTLTTGWARYTATFTWPSTAGATLGTTAYTSYSQLSLFLSAPAANTTTYPQSGNLGAQTGTINIWGVQLEFGSQATPFEHRDPEIELGLCQRFYQGWQIRLGGYLATSLATDSISYLRTMRVTPTASLSGTTMAGVATAATVATTDANTLQATVTISTAGSYNVASTLALSADL